MATIAGVKPHPIYLAGSWVDSPDILEIANPARPGELGGLDLPRDRGAVRAGGRGGGPGVRGDAEAPGLRARPDPARDQRRHQGAARGARARSSRRSRQADPRRADRGRPRGAHVQARGRGGGARVRRGDPARPHAELQGPGRDHAALPDRADRGHLAVQLPAQPGRAQGRPGDRLGQPDRAQAAVQGPAGDARRGGDHDSVGVPEGRSRSCR